MKAAKLLAFAAVLGMVGVAMAAEDAPKKKRTPGIYGTIAKIEGTAPDLTLVIDKRTRGSKETTQVTVKTNGETKFTIDSETATLAKLTVKMRVFITPETASKSIAATNIRASTKTRQRKPKDK